MPDFEALRVSGQNLRTGAVDDRIWTTNNSSFEHYCRGLTFPSKKSFQTIVTESGIKNGIGLDVGAGSNAVALRDLLDSGILRKALATNYEDRRSREVRQDSRLGHVSGNILAVETWLEIDAWRQAHAPQGFDLIFHRPYGYLQNFPPQFYEAASNILLDLLRPGGIFFTQVPEPFVVRPDARQAICRRIKARGDISRIMTSTWPSSTVEHAVIRKASVRPALSRKSPYTR